MCALVFVCLRGDRVPAAAPTSSEFLVDVSTVAELQAAVANLASGVTVRLAPGRYALTQELRLRPKSVNLLIYKSENQESGLSGVSETGEPFVLLHVFVFFVPAATRLTATIG